MRALRAFLFRKLLAKLERHTPDVVRRLQCQILLNTTAKGFGARGRWICFYPADRALREYAAFSVRCMTCTMADRDRLFEQARRTGARIRRVTGFTEDEDIRRLIFYLYRNISIQMHGSLPGEIEVTDCYFSRLYSPRQCSLMSCVDSGIMSGMHGGGRLKFTQRITQGCTSCRACFKEAE